MVGTTRGAKVPGPYVHIGSLWHSAEQFRKGGYGRQRVRQSGPGRRQRRQPRRDHDENPNFAAIGAVGPEIFFFLPDFRDLAVGSSGSRIPTASVRIGVLDFLEQVYNAPDPYIGKREHFLGPISDDTAEEMSRLSGGHTETVGDISAELSGILTTPLEALAVMWSDLRESFSLGSTRGGTTGACAVWALAHPRWSNR
jgi:hypothetical protein